MNDINKLPPKCRVCPYWELAKFPWCCGDCADSVNPRNGEYIKRIDAKMALTALPADLDSEVVQRCIEAMNKPKAADVEPVVRCKDCKYKPTAPDGITYGFQVEFPDEEHNLCPCQCEDGWYSWMPPDDFFCAYGAKMDKDKEK